MNEQTIKALTIHQPWATFIALGAKKFETRHWATNYRGRLLIHAGKSTDHLPDDMTTKVAGMYPLGCVIAVVNLVDCCPVEGLAITQFEYGLGNFSPGRFAWRMANPVKLDKPIPYKGQQGLFNVPVSVLPEDFR